MTVKLSTHFMRLSLKIFYKRDLKGKELAEWKYQRYMRDYAKSS